MSISHAKHERLAGSSGRASPVPGQRQFRWNAGRTGDRARAATINIQIAGDHVARIEDGRGMLVYVRFGTVWITQSGSSKDFFVHAGQSLRIDRNGLTLLSVTGGTPPALVTLVPSRRPASSPATRVAGGTRRLWARLFRVARSAPSSRAQSRKSSANAVRIGA